MQPRERPVPKRERPSHDAAAGQAAASFGAQAYAKCGIRTPTRSAGNKQADADPLAAAEAEKAEMKDKLLRTLADMEYLRRRQEKEVADCARLCRHRLRARLLTVADNIHRALGSVPRRGARSRWTGPLKALIDGNRTHRARSAQDHAERHGVRKLSPEGEKFDPNLHQANVRGAPSRGSQSDRWSKVVQDGLCHRRTRAASGHGSGCRKGPCVPSRVSPPDPIPRRRARIRRRRADRATPDSLPYGLHDARPVSSPIRYRGACWRGWLSLAAPCSRRLL